jgi:alkylated DNA repair dioxygenase AlkB
MTQQNLFSSDEPEKAIGVLPKDGKALFLAAFFTEDEAESLFTRLHEEIDWRQDTTQIYGRIIDLPRLTAWYGDLGRHYSYSGIHMDPAPWTSTLTEIKQRVDNAAGTTFNSVLLNLYRDGRDGVSWHSDDERELGGEPVIASLSLGDTRKFAFRHRTEKKLRIEIALTTGSLLIMSGLSQECWDHQIPKTSRKVDPRINLTFRTIL